MRELAEKVLLGSKSEPSTSTGAGVWGELSCIEVRAETFLLKAQSLMYASLKNRKTSLLAKDTYLFLATTKCRIPLLQYLCPQPGHRGCQRRTAAPTCASQQSFTQFDSRCSQTAEGRPSSTSRMYGSTSSRKLIKMQSRALM